MRVPPNECNYVSISLSVCRCLLCVWVCVCVCVSVCLSTCALVYVSARLRETMHMRTHVRTYLRPCMRPSVRVYACAEGEIMITQVTLTVVYHRNSTSNGNKRGL